MREIKVLFGFKNQKTEDSIVKELQALGCKVNGEMRYRKHMIADYVKEHPDLDAVILKEYLDGGERYGTQELVSLADDSNANIVVVLRSGHRGHDMMRELYHAGILNAYFTSGTRGAKPEMLAELVLHSRTRRQAREYYRIDEKPLHREILAHEEFRDCFSYLINEGEGIHIMDRFSHISGWLTPQQMGIFVSTLPEDVTDVLKQYDEFYKIHAQLYRRRYVRTPLKKPKGTTQALSAEMLSQAMQKETEKGEEEKPPEITPVTIRMVNHMPVAPEEDEREKINLRTQEIIPGGGYEGRKKTSAEEDIYDVADRKIGREVKPLFFIIERFNFGRKKEKIPREKKKRLRVEEDLFESPAEANDSPDDGMDEEKELCADDLAGIHGGR